MPAGSDPVLLEILSELRRIRRRMLAPPTRMSSFVLGDGTTDNPAAVLTPNEVRELFKFERPGSIIFSSAHSNSPYVDFRVEIDDLNVVHTLSGSLTVADTFTTAHFPGFFLQRADAANSAWAWVFSPGDSFGIPFGKNMRFTVKNTGTTNAALKLIIMRIYESID
jgi:hypothetical protein